MMLMFIHKLIINIIISVLQYFKLIALILLIIKNILIFH